MNVLIIGAGPSGIVAAKEAIDAGLRPLVLEKSSGIGGVWNQEAGSTWHSMSTNLSKYSCMFSDFPWSFETDTFPSSNDMLSYLHEYIRHFKLEAYFRFNCSVQDVSQCEDETWDVIYTDETTGMLYTEHVPYVVVASGIFSRPAFPEGVNQDHPSIIHAKQYKSNAPYEGKTVVVVVGSFTGCEIAANVAQTAANVIHIVSSPHWILKKYLADVPVDIAFYARSSRDGSLKSAQDIPPEAAEKFHNNRKNSFFRSLCEPQLEKQLLPKSDGENPPFVAISSEYITALNTGNIALIVGLRVNSTTENTLLLSDGSTITADNLIFCTGYHAGLEFLSSETKKSIDYQPEDLLQPLLLYKTTLHPQVKNMSFVGLYRGPYFAVIELQARWSMALFSGACSAPTAEQFYAGLELEKSIRTSIPRPQFPHGDYIGLADSLADEIGAVPPLESLKASDPTLYHLLYNNPVIPSHYRLFGLNARPDVARLILDELHQLMLSGNYAIKRPLSTSIAALSTMGFLSQQRCAEGEISETTIENTPK